VLRPALKVSIPYFVADEAVHFRDSGTLISLEDPDGRVLALLRLIDGSRDSDAIWRDLLAEFPDVTAEDVSQAIRDLDESGLIQDASDTGRDFDVASAERWAPNFGFFETYASMSVSKYEFQRRIRDCKIAVLGVGGVGTHLLIDLVAIGFTDIKIVDFDRVELSNLNRQILYGEAFLGQQKVHIAADRARALNSSITLTAEQTRLMSADEVYRVVSDRDIVIGSADGPKMEFAHWLNEACVRAGAALISGGVDTRRALMYTAVPGISGCVECWYDQVQKADPTTRMVSREMRAIEARDEAFGEDTAAFNGLVTLLAAHMVGEVVRLASRVAPPLSVGRLIEMTFHDPQLTVTETLKRLPDCRICQSAAARPVLNWLATDPLPLPF
jgi:molybdopterin/thiamine biosynthesis adenylyltransferase